MALLSSLKKFCEFFDPIVKLLLIPIFVVFIYAGTAYLDRNYVSKQYFNAEFQTENKAALDSISGKLDTLIISSATGSQRLADLERRITRLEDKADGAKTN